MAAAKLYGWLEEQWDHAAFWWIKRLAANDTLAFSDSDAGPKIPTEVILEFLPQLDDSSGVNPKTDFVAIVDSHATEVTATASLFSKSAARGRNRARVTNWDDSAKSLLDPENTGAVGVFAFHSTVEGSLPECHVWVCTDLAEEEMVESIYGSIEPGVDIRWSKTQGKSTRLSSSADSLDGPPADWFPPYPSR